MKRLLLTTLVLLCACSEQKQETETTTPESQSDSNTMTQAAAGMMWQAPEDWTKEMPTSSMRKAQYRLPGVESDPEDASVVVFYFQGEGGGVQANIERWVSQFKQPENGQLQPETEKQTVNGLQQTIVDVSGTYLFKTRPMAPTATEKPGFRMLAAVIEGAESGPWFVKCVGPEKTMAKWEDSIYQFLQTFQQPS